MTYEQRIEAIKLVLQPLLKHSGLIDWREEDSTIADLADKVARAADRACLAAIEEPTSDMSTMGLIRLGVLKNGEQAWRVHSDSIYRAMWSAIDRGKP